MAQKVGHGRAQDEVKDTKKWGKKISSEESYGALKLCLLK